MSDTYQISNSMNEEVPKIDVHSSMSTNGSNSSVASFLGSVNNTSSQIAETSNHIAEPGSKSDLLPIHNLLEEQLAREDRAHAEALEKTIKQEASIKEMQQELAELNKCNKQLMDDDELKSLEQKCKIELDNIADFRNKKSASLSEAEGDLQRRRKVYLSMFLEFMEQVEAEIVKHEKKYDTLGHQMSDYDIIERLATLNHGANTGLNDRTLSIDINVSTHQKREMSRRNSEGYGVGKDIHVKKAYCKQPLPLDNKMPISDISNGSYKNRANSNRGQGSVPPSPRYTVINPTPRHKDNAYSLNHSSLVTKSDNGISIRHRMQSISGPEQREQLHNDEGKVTDEAAGVAAGDALCKLYIQWKDLMVVLRDAEQREEAAISDVRSIEEAVDRTAGKLAELRVRLAVTDQLVTLENRNEKLIQEIYQRLPICQTMEVINVDNDKENSLQKHRAALTLLKSEIIQGKSNFESAQSINVMQVKKRDMLKRECDRAGLSLKEPLMLQRKLRGQQGYVMTPRGRDVRQTESNIVSSPKDEASQSSHGDTGMAASVVPSLTITNQVCNDSYSNDGQQSSLHTAAGTGQLSSSIPLDITEGSATSPAFVPYMEVRMGLNNSSIRN
eukprot:Tbor_TRINITY_DN2023_c0_g1::TRINITY_DN2023_c0_g1_i1::g.12137::m.12137